MDEIQNKIKHWDRFYRVYRPTILGTIMYNSHRKILERVMNRELELPRDAKLLDVGCGRGSTLTSFREWGFTDTIGIEVADSGLELCQQNGLILGKDIFKIDATNTPYKDRSFDVVFSEGILEHYEDFTPFVDEMCRLSNDYIILTQPNHFCLYGRLMQWGWERFRKTAGGVREYSYRFETFYSVFADRGFTHLFTRYTPLRENAVLVFRRGCIDSVDDKQPITKWQEAQEREKKYIGSRKDLEWGIPHSLEYWENFLHLDNIDGKGVEIGCGLNGVYRFAENIMGIDPIDFSEYSNNFIQGVGEELPFESKSVDFVICCNAIDHSQNPRRVLDEIFRITNRAVLWVYIYPRVVGWIMDRVDRSHPYHLTWNSFGKLFSGRPLLVTKRFSYTGIRGHWRYAKRPWLRLKLLMAHLLGVRGFCVHLEADEGFVRTRERAKGFVESFMPDPICRHIVLEAEGIYNKMKGVILDIGCGTGYFMSRFENSVGLDISVGNVIATKRMLPRREIILGDASYLPIRHGCLDGAVFMQVIEHIPEPVEAVREIHRCLRIRGKFLLGYEIYSLMSSIVRVSRVVINRFVKDEEYGHRETILSDNRDWLVCDQRKIDRLLRPYFSIIMEKKIRGLLMNVMVALSVVVDRVTRPRYLRIKPMGDQYTRLSSLHVRLYVRCIVPLIISVARWDPVKSVGNSVLTFAEKLPSEDRKGGIGGVCE